MNKMVQEENFPQCESGWEGVLADGQRALSEALARVRRIRKGITWVNKQINRGRSFDQFIAENRSQDLDQNQRTVIAEGADLREARVNADQRTTRPRGLHSL